jgi:hypothetical protein
MFEGLEEQESTEVRIRQRETDQDHLQRYSLKMAYKFSDLLLEQLR